MPSTNYLDDDPSILPEDEERKRLLADTFGESNDGSSFSLPKPPTLAPQNNSAPKFGLPSKASPPAAAAPSAAPGLDPSSLNKSSQRYATVVGQKPLAPQPKWWQRLAAGAVGGLAGFSNSQGKGEPIDPRGATDAIMGGPGYRRKLSDWQTQVQGAEAQKAADKEQLGAAEAVRSQQATEELKRAEAEKNRQQGTYYEGRNAAATQGKKEADAERDKQRATRAFGESTKGLPVIYRTAEDPPPQGWQKVPMSHPDMPGMIAYTPPAIAPVPKELAPYMPGYPEGTMAPRDALTKAGDVYRGELAKKNVQADKPTKEVSNLAQVLLNPKEYTSEQVQTAQRLFAQEHRDPNAGLAGLANVPSRNPALGPAQRDERVLASSPAGVQAIVKQLVDYKYQLPTGISVSKPYWQNIMQLAAQYDPSFDASQYNTRQAIRKDFTSGKTSSGINALNTVTQHIDRLEQNWSKLNNAGGLATATNAPVNWVGQKVSGDFQNRMNRFQLDQEAVSNELMRVWRQVGASESEIKQWAAKLSPNLSPEAQKGAIQEVLELIKGKLGALKSQYERGMGRPADFKIVQPDALKRFQKHGVDVQDLTPRSTYSNSDSGDGVVKMRAPDGSVKPVPADQVEHYKKAGAVVVQ